MDIGGSTAQAGPHQPRPIRPKPPCGGLRARPMALSQCPKRIKIPEMRSEENGAAALLKKTLHLVLAVIMKRIMVQPVGPDVQTIQRRTGKRQIVPENGLPAGLHLAASLMMN